MEDGSPRCCHSCCLDPHVLLTQEQMCYDFEYLCVPDAVSGFLSI